MSLRVSRERPVHEPVPLPGGGVWNLRPAMSTDQDLAQARTARLMAGVIAGGDALAQLQDLLAGAIELGDGPDPEAIAILSRFLGDVHLAAICSNGWEGLVDDDGAPMPEPDVGAIALVFRDSGIRYRVHDVIYRDLHQVVTEKNGSAASPNGGAAEGQNTARNAAPAETRAHSATAATPASGARKSSTRHKRQKASRSRA